ncbi:MAG: TRAP transporter large permease subunit [Sulfolobales archaeon]
MTIYPLALSLYLLESTRSKRIGLALASISVLVAAYLRTYFEDLIHFRAGSYNIIDVIVALVVMLLTMTYLIRESRIIFVLSVFLLTYSVYGWLFPGILYHPGISPIRTLTSLTIEFETGVFGMLAEIAVAIISAFLIFQGIIMGFGFLDSITKVIVKLFSKRVHFIPQMSVVSSLAVAMVSGSGAANVAATGQFTIPLMKKIGLPSEVAGAVECSASEGGLIMPPIMASIAFLVAANLGVSYWDVCIRGFIISAIYYAGTAYSVYLLALRRIKSSGAGGVMPLAEVKVSRVDVFKTAIFFASVAALCYAIAVFQYTVYTAALYVSAGLLCMAIVVEFSQSLYEQRKVSMAISRVVSCVKSTVLQFARSSSRMTLLLGSLGIVVGCFVITGWSIRLIQALILLTGGNIYYATLLSLVVGAFLGMGLPPVGIYVIFSVTVLPVLEMLGINPWVAEMYAFLIGLQGEIVPPVSVVAAVASKISGGSYLRTVFEFFKLGGLGIYCLLFAILRWPWLTVEIGPLSVASVAIVALGIMCIYSAIHLEMLKHTTLDKALRLAEFIIALLTLYYFNPYEGYSYMLCVALLAAFMFYNILRLLEVKRT